MTRGRTGHDTKVSSAVQQAAQRTVGRAMAALAISMALGSAMHAVATSAQAQEFPKRNFEPSEIPFGGLLIPIPQILSSVAFTTQKSPNPITAACVNPAVKNTAEAGWVRGFGGEFDTDLSGDHTIGGQPAGRLTAENNTTFKTLQGGADTVLCDIGPNGGNLHLGITLGNTWGDSDQRNVPEGTGTDLEFETFFVGPYAAYTRGDLAILTSLRFDHHSIEVTNPSLAPGKVDFDAESVSGSATVSHDFALDPIIITPEVGFNVSKTRLDSFEMGGGTVHLGDLWSALGHVGVTGRKTVMITDELFLVPFVSLTGYHEFADKAESRMVFPGGGVVESEPRRIGTFGEVGVGLNAVKLGDVGAGEPTFFSGARVDMQFGEHLDGFTATVFGRIQF